MFREEKNLKDSSANLGISLSDTHALISYTKTDKLVIALYMVTDIIDKDEPLRNKLRTLATEIISDINVVPIRASGKISEVMSFLDIASAINIISQMNCNILRKEFLELDRSIKESAEDTGNMGSINKKIDLSEFFTEGLEEPIGSHPSVLPGSYNSLPAGQRGHGHLSHRIGVQKGETLMKAIRGMSDRMPSSLAVSDKNKSHKSGEDFDALKKQRREDIINMIKIMGGSATIKDIKDKAKSLPAGALASCGEKTLQRELVSMVRDGVLNKTGEKRWSKYFVK